MAGPAVVTNPKAVQPGKFEQELQAMDAGVLKDIPAKSSLAINGKAMTGAQIDTQLKSYLSTFAAADQAKQQYQTAVVARRNVTTEARDFYLQIKKAIIAFFGAQSAQLADFGLKAAKARAPRTSQQKMLSAAKAQLTREARGTASKKQKAKINPTVGTPMVAVAAEGKATTAPSVVNPSLPSGSTPAPAGSGTPASTPQDAGSSAQGSSNAPAGGGAKA